MTAHAAVRVGYVRLALHWLRAIWTGPRRLTHAIGDRLAALAWDLDIRLDERAARRDRDEFGWPDDPRIGVVHPDPDDFPAIEDVPGPALSAPSAPATLSVADQQSLAAGPGAELRGWSSAVQYWAALARASVGLTDVPLPVCDEPVLSGTVAGLPSPDPALPAPGTAPIRGAVVELSPAPDVPGVVAAPQAAAPGAANLSGTGGDGRTQTERAHGADRSLAASETAIDMDAYLIDLLTCAPAKIAAVARRHRERYEQQTEREVAAWLTGLAEVAS